MAGRKRPDHRRIKIHRTYNVAELSQVTGVHRNTVRNWIKQGLQVIEGRRPILVKGVEAKRFLEERRRTAKQPCGPGELFCVGCRAPRAPAGGIVDYLPQTDRSGMLRGICSVCDRLINKCVSLASLDAISANLEIAFPHGQRRICETA